MTFCPYTHSVDKDYCVLYAKSFIVWRRFKVALTDKNHAVFKKMCWILFSLYFTEQRRLTVDMIWQ